MNFKAIAAPDFDLAKTLDSGQVFYWQSLGDGFVGMIGDVPVYLERRGSKLLVRPETANLIRHYFALDHPLRKICASFPCDRSMNEARDFCKGLRIIRQPIWECLASFICSSMKQVAHIRQMSRALRERFGTRHQTAGITLHAFPSAARIAESSEAELRECALGYRAKNLHATATRVAEDEADLEAWRKLADNDLRMRLMDLPGVGAKVANCVMLFAYERLKAFPIDVWIERVLREKYFPRRRKFRPNELERFSEKYFGEHGGYAQQYLFHHARKTMPRKKNGSRKLSS